MHHKNRGQITAKSLKSLGFLTVVQSSDYGLFGGYLVLSLDGRPLEFHCTAPVRANRAQEILYGPTLEPFLYGEQISRTLITHSKLQPTLVLTNLRPVLAVREMISTPVGYIEKISDPMDHSGTHAELPNNVTTPAPNVKVGDYLVELSVSAHAVFSDQLIATGRQIDLLEPFERIDQAIREAQRAGQPSRDVA